MVRPVSGSSEGHSAQPSSARRIVDAYTSWRDEPADGAGLRKNRGPSLELPSHLQTERTRTLLRVIREGAPRRGQRQQSELVRSHPSLESARNRALEEVGSLGDGRVKTRARLGAHAGQVNGFQSADGQRGFRVDYDPDKGVHFNWYDWSGGDRGSGGRWGAEIFPGTAADYARLIRQLNR